MQYQADWLDARDGARLMVHHWLPEGQPVALVLISHGMAEHGARYTHLAEALVGRGYAAAALDQRGHGLSIQDGKRGHFSSEGGWGRVTGDLLEVLEHLKSQFPDRPIHLLGHSMGSYIAQGFLLDHSHLVQTAILSGSNAHPPALSRFGRLVARAEGFLRGQDHPAPTMNRVSFGQFNRNFRPARTDFDWLSRDPEEVDAYINDPLCGFACTARLWQDLFGGLLAIADDQALKGIRKDLPILIVGGSADPVSAGSGLQKLQQRLQQAGLSRVELQLYPDARHEVFNETNRDQVVAQLIDWLDHHTPTP